MSNYVIAMELAKTSELLQCAYALLRQRDREIQILQQNAKVHPVTESPVIDLLKLLSASQAEEYQP